MISIERRYYVRTLAWRSVPCVWFNVLKQAHAHRNQSSHVYFRIILGNTSVGGAPHWVLHLLGPIVARRGKHRVHARNGEQRHGWHDFAPGAWSCEARELCSKEHNTHALIFSPSSRPFFLRGVDSSMNWTLRSVSIHVFLINYSFVCNFLRLHSVHWRVIHHSKLLIGQ